MIYGPPILVEREINYPYLHGLPQKYKSPRMWATEGQFLENVGLPNTRLPNLVFYIFFFSISTQL